MRVWLAWAAVMAVAWGQAPVRKVAPPPPFMVLRVAGVDLLHADAAGIVRRLGRPQQAAVADGRSLVYRDSRGGCLLQFVMDEESGAVRRVRAKVEPAPPGTAPTAFRLPPAPLDGRLSLGDAPAAVERALGRPQAVERGKDGRVDWVYRAAMRPDGSLPAYRSRWTFLRGRLADVNIVIGE